MKLVSTSMVFENQKLYILDQTLLPHIEEFIEINSVPQMVEVIKDLKVRGAPAIGVSAGLCLYQFTDSMKSVEEFKAAAKLLRDSRPTAVNLMVVIDEILKLCQGENWREKVKHRAIEFFHEDVKLCARMGKIGAELINDGDGILHHCNTGGLATVGIGTALGVIKTAHDQGKKIHVFVDETRPLLQGGRLTAYELKKWGIPYTLITDNMAAQVMKEGRVQKIFVGADRIALNGDFANKIGTYSVAVLAHYHKIPMYPVAPYTTIDFELKDGSAIPIEQRDGDEVRGAKGSFGKIIWAPLDAPTYNPSFDVTPASLIAGLVTEKGFFSASDLRSGKLAISYKL
jgi:methylthioribose-1-phosphate isomerase